MNTLTLNSLSKQTKRRAYIDLSPLLNSPAFWKEAFTDRGDGKTTAIIKTALQSRQRTGLTPVLCRRWRTEMGEPFKNDVLEKIAQFMPELYNNCDLQWTGTFQKGGLFLIDKSKPEERPYIHAFPLSMAGRLKSGLDVKTHRNLYIDEYVPLDGRYMANEAEVILELYRTIDRDALLSNDPYLNYVLICGNRVGRPPATDIYFGVDHDYGKNALNLYKDGTYAILTYANQGHVAEVKRSKLAHLTSNTPYDNYAKGGELRPSTPLIWRKTLPPIHVYLNTPNGVCTLYFTFKDKFTVLICGAEPARRDTNEPFLTIDPCDNSKAVWIKRIPRLCDTIRRAFAAGCIYYTSRPVAERYRHAIEYLSRL